jgi:hypothetical protein
MRKIVKCRLDYALIASAPSQIEIARQQPPIVSWSFGKRSKDSSSRIRLACPSSVSEYERKVVALLKEVKEQDREIS